MDAERLQVFVRIPLPDGTERLQRIGTASRDEKEVVVTLEGLSLEPNPEPPPPPPPHFPVVPHPLAPAPVESTAAAQASVKRLLALEQLAERSRKVLSDEKKLKWHHDVRTQLELIELEISRLRARKGVKTTDE